MTPRSASQVALVFVIVVVGGSFFWWFRDRPSFILYKAHKGVGQLGQAAAIAEYRKLLSSTRLTKEDEVKYRVELGTLYLRALEESNGLSRYVIADPDKPTHPFLDDAKKEFDRAIKIDPDNAEAHLHLGQIFWLRNMESYAIEELEIGRKKDPTNPAALRYLSAVYLERGDAVKARDIAQQALAIRPDYDEARFVLTEAYHQLGDTMSSLIEYDRISEGYRDVPHIRAQHALYLAAQNFWEESNAEIERAMRDAPGSGPIKLIYGQLMLERGAPDVALGAFLQAGDLMPRNAWPMFWKARALAAKRSCDEPERISDLLTEIWPRWQWGRYLKAWFHLCKSDDEKAVAELNESIRLSADFAESLRLRARLLYERGQFDALAVAVRPMLDQKILEGEGHVYLALSLLERGEFALAADMAETAIRLNQRNADAFMALGEIRAALGDGPGAQRAFETAQGLNPYRPDLKARYLRFLARAGQGERASSEFQVLVARNPESAAVWTRYGESHLIAGNNSDAIIAFKNAISEAPWMVDAQLGLGEAYRRSGNQAMAINAFSKAATLSPKHPRLTGGSKKAA